MCQCFTGLNWLAGFLGDIKTASIFVDDHSESLRFDTETLGFKQVNDIDLGEFRRLTVPSDDSGGTELLLEPNAHPSTKRYQAAIYADGIPATSFHTADI
ncbi:MAG: VOC family protein [Pseudohongiellaceae bacterium]